MSVAAEKAVLPPVADLVARGRYPHQSFLRQWSKADEEAVVSAMEATRVTELSGRLVDEACVAMSPI